jgi:hypothetical protein
MGAILLTLAAQNRRWESGPGDNPQSLSTFFIVSVGILVTMHAVMTMEYNFTNQMHSARFYRVAGMVFPVILVAAGRAGRVRYPATAVALVYMAVTLVMIWLLQLFPAEPKLAPITHPIDRMTPPHFPILMVAPALVVDLLMQRARGLGDWILALVLGAAFIVVLLAVQWFFADFLLSPLARNYFFAAGQWGYNEGPGDWYYRFWELDGPDDEWSPAHFARGIAVAVLVAAVGSRVGLWMGKWMAQVRR